MKPIDEVLTSDLFHYFVGQSILWLVLAIGAVLVARHFRTWLSRITFGIALAAAFVGSFMPLFVRWLASDPGLGGPDAAAEETIFSFFATLPQATVFVLLVWLVLRNTKTTEQHSTQSPSTA